MLLSIYLSSNFETMKLIFILLGLSVCGIAMGQSNLATYMGNGGKETLYDVFQLSDGTVLATGYADNLNWLPADISIQYLDYSGSIPNSLGSNRYGVIVHLSANVEEILHVVAFPQGTVEDVRYIKTNGMPYQQTQDLYISCTTADTENNNGGYIIAKLNGNFIDQVPTALDWHNVVWAASYAQLMHPWDVTSDGKVYYVSGEAHGYDWSAMYCLDANGARSVVEHWRTHWIDGGGEWKGTPASSYSGGAEALAYSGIVFKIGGRCELRSWTQDEFESIEPDGNGGTRKGHWPADFLFNGPCDPNSPTANGPGYTGYSAESCCPVWGASSVVVDRTNNHMYLGMNFKSYSQPADSPDFEPAVIAFDADGAMLWWSRLYHEITPAGDTVYSLPDQYVDALAIDYTQGQLVVAARAHGNNTENLWEGNEIASNPAASGFQNRFTGTQGDIHESWIGKLDLQTGDLIHATYVAEYAEGTGGLGTPLADPNAGNWPDPNTGWPDLNTTYIAKNNMKISSNGDVLIAGQGRRTMTTVNAWQQMPLPQSDLAGCWNSFLRLYRQDLRYPKYSSLVVGEWDTQTQTGGDNIRIFGVYKTHLGILAVGRHLATAGGQALGNPMPVSNVPYWGASAPNGESAVLLYLQNDSLSFADDQFNKVMESNRMINRLWLYPNPADDSFAVSGLPSSTRSVDTVLEVFDQTGRCVLKQVFDGRAVAVDALKSGCYVVRCTAAGLRYEAPLFILH